MNRIITITVALLTGIIVPTIYIYQCFTNIETFNNLITSWDKKLQTNDINHLRTYRDKNLYYSYIKTNNNTKNINTKSKRNNNHRLFLVRILDESQIIKDESPTTIREISTTLVTNTLNTVQTTTQQIMPTFTTKEYTEKHLVKLDEYSSSIWYPDNFYNNYGKDLYNYFLNCDFTYTTGSGDLVLFNEKLFINQSNEIINQNDLIKNMNNQENDITSNNKVVEDYYKYFGQCYYGKGVLSGNILIDITNNNQVINYIAVPANWCNFNKVNIPLLRQLVMFPWPQNIELYSKARLISKSYENKYYYRLGDDNNLPLRSPCIVNNIDYCYYNNDYRLLIVDCHYTKSTGELHICNYSNYYDTEENKHCFKNGVSGLYNMNVPHYGLLIENDFILYESNSQIITDIENLQLTTPIILPEIIDETFSFMDDFGQLNVSWF